MVNFTRLDFTSHTVLQNPCLVGLARDIACYPALRARADGLLTNNPPLNFLANPAGTAWVPHGSIPRVDAAAVDHLARWKYAVPSTPPPPARLGYDDAAHRAQCGLGLLFDPYVDAFLAAHAFHGVRLPVDPVVLVLTDFGSLSSIDLLGTGRNDWALTETRDFLNGKAKDFTSRKLYECLVREGRLGEDEFSMSIVRRELLVWNLVPFIRDAPSSVGAHGFPPIGAWLNQCWDWTRIFCDCVNARTVVLGPDKNFVTPATARAGRTVKPLGHPSSWKSRERFRSSCDELRALAPVRVVKGATLDLEE